MTILELFDKCAHSGNISSEGSNFRTTAGKDSQFKDIPFTVSFCFL